MRFNFLGTGAHSHLSPAMHSPCGSLGKAPPPVSLRLVLVNGAKTCSLPCGLGRWLGCEETRGRAAGTVTGPWVTPLWPEFSQLSFSLKSHFTFLPFERIEITAIFHLPAT